MSIIFRQGLRVAILGAVVLAAGVVSSNAQSRYYGYGSGYYNGGYQYQNRRVSRYQYRQLKRYQRRQLARLIRQQRRQRRALRRAYRNQYYNGGNVYYRSNNRYYNNYRYRRN